MWCAGGEGDGEEEEEGGGVSLFVAGAVQLLGKAADGQVVHHLLDLLHVVLEAVVALAQRVVLQVQQAEAGVELVDEVGDAQRPAVVARGHAVDRQPRLDGKTQMDSEGWKLWEWQ